MTITTRRTLLKSAAAFGAASALASPLIAKGQAINSVIIVGAGSAGLTAAYHLTKAGVDVQVLEAANKWGGRVARLQGFADFPIDLGAEWIHTDPGIMGKMLGLDWDDMGVETIDYRPQTYGTFSNGEFHRRDILRHAYAEVKFKATTWYGFLERFMLPTIQDKIRLNTAVQSIAHDADGVAITLANGRRMTADRVLVATPISAFKNRKIQFSGQMPARFTDGVDSIKFGQGLKAFMRTNERFYPDLTLKGSILDFTLDDSWDSLLYYDAAFGKDTDDNVLALFNVAQQGLPRAALGTRDLKQNILAEVEEFFGTDARNSITDMVVQNWTAEPFIGGSYSMDFEGDMGADEIFAPVENRIFFAGEAMGGDNQSTVHGASLSAIDAVEQMLSA